MHLIFAVSWIPCTPPVRSVFLFLLSPNFPWLVASGHGDYKTITGLNDKPPEVFIQQREVLTSLADQYGDSFLTWKELSTRKLK